MVNMKHALGAAALLVSIPAAAQAPNGISFDQTITTVSSTSGRVDTTSNVVHALAAGNNMRVETTKNTLYPKMGPFDPGPHAVLLMRGGGSEMSFVNPDSREYLSVKPLEMMAGFKKMLEGMGGSMTFDTSVTRMSVDSVGPGPTIDNHQTVHYTLRTAVKMTVVMMGQTMTNEDVSATEVYTAPDMSEFSDVTNGMVNQFADVARSMGMEGPMVDRMKASQKKIPGFPLRLVKQTTQTQRGVTRTSTETIESRNVKHASAPDSLFAIPAGYKSVSMPALPSATRENAP
jgi:hypothetical protein